MELDVSIVIINYNTKNLTLECIESIFKHTKNINFEVIVVDNGSTDGSKEFFETYKNINYIYLNKNLGFGKANNIGSNYAKGKYLFFLNSDTILINNAAGILFEYIDNSINMGATGGQLYNSDLSLQSSYSKIPDLKYIIKSTLGLKNKVIAYNKNISLDGYYISGADLMIRKDIFDEFNGFDEKYFMYYEESDLQYRISRRNLSIGFSPFAKILHYNEGSQKTLKNFSNPKLYKNKLLLRYQSRLIFFQKFYNNKLLLLKSILIVGSILRFLKLKKEIFSVIKFVINYK